MTITRAALADAAPQAGYDAADIVCFSHLRWDFVFQRPQQLLTRFAKRRRVLFIEEPMHTDGDEHLELMERDGGVTVARARMRLDRPAAQINFALASMIDGLLAGAVRGPWIAWYYTPMALAYSAHLQPSLVVYDCMDELSAFAGAPPEMLERERELLQIADVVFCGGPSLYESKRTRHRSVWSFPSSIDVAHFRPARRAQESPDDQKAIPVPRLGYFGVIDERLDLALLADAAALRPDWQFVLIGPVVKIDPATLPQAANIHYLGQKSYAELPSYISGWDVAMMPFALNASTRFISPTKTPEYLAAGRRVVSTPIRDVVSMYGSQGLVRIAATAEEFVAAAAASLDDIKAGRDATWLRKVDQVLASMSWDSTWLSMEEVISSVAAEKAAERDDRMPVIPWVGARQAVVETASV